MGVQHKTVRAEDDGQRIDRWLQKYFPQASYILIQKTLRKGEIRVNKGRAKPSTRLGTGDDVRIPPQFIGSERPPSGEVSAKDRDYIKSLVIFEDADIIAINKPSGLAVQGGTKTTRHVDGLLDGLKKNKKDARPKLVHRLDKETSGILILAKTPDAARYLTKAFQGKEIQKTYAAITVPAPIQKSGDVRGALIKKGGKGFEKMHVDEDDGKRARTLFEVIDTMGQEAALVAFQPLSGRTHQIRVHTAEILEAPILGDKKYGYDGENLESLNLPNQIHLHAAEIYIPKPRSHGDGWHIKAKLPKIFRKSCEILGLETHFENPFSSY